MKKKTKESIAPSPSQKDELPCSYSLHLYLDCLPQENGRWVCRASLSDWRINAIEYGQTREESIAKALYTIAQSLEAKSVASIRKT